MLTTTDAGGDIVFVSTVDSYGILRTLELKAAGNTTLGGAVGGISPLYSLVVDTSAGTTYLNGTAINTSLSQTYNNPVILGNNVVLTTTDASGNIEFVSTINSDATSRGLTLNAVRSTTLKAAIGATNALDYLTVTAPGGININGGAVNTTLSQTTIMQLFRS